jgi:cyanophycinase-like exopeptidase
VSDVEAGPIALVGSGEYLEEMADLEASLLAGRPGRYVQLATAAVPDGPDVVARWHRLGIAQAQRLDVEPIVLDVTTRADADNPAIAARVAGAGLIYLSGGHPAFLADTLRESALWSAILDAWRAGAALAGCSAGAMAMTSWIPSLRHPRRGTTPGLGLLPHLRVIPHFDAFSRRVPDLVTQYLVARDPSVSVLGIDENTALVGGPFEWTVRGHASVWRLDDDARERFDAGATISTP